MVRGLLGESYLRTSHLDRAERCAQRALAQIPADDPSHYLRAGHLCLLGRVYRRQGHLTHAIRTYRRGLSLVDVRSSHFSPLAANLAYALLYRGHVGEANARVTEYWEVARGVATQTWSMAAVESGVGIELGDLDRAARALDHAESAGDLGERIGLVLRNHRAAVCRASGEWARAEALERSILGRSVAGGRNGDMVACAARGLAESLAGQGRHEDALEPARLAARTGRGEDRAEWAAGLRVLGGSLTALGRRAEATRAFQEALSLHDRAEFELERRRLDADLSRLGFGDLARVTLDSASQMAGGRADRLRSEELSLRSGRIAGERAALERALTESGGNVSRAARSLGLSRQAFYKAMRRTGLSADARA